MKHWSAWEVTNWYSVQYSSFSKVKTPDDGRLRPKHIVRMENEGMNGCIVTEVLLCVKCNNATGCLNTILHEFCIYLKGTAFTFPDIITFAIICVMGNSASHTYLQCFCEQTHHSLWLLTMELFSLTCYTGSTVWLEC
jgi:hypothetical protein